MGGTRREGHFGPPPNGGNINLGNNLNLVLFAQPKLSFQATLNLPDLSKLINDLIMHLLGWP